MTSTSSPKVIENLVQTPCSTQLTMQCHLLVELRFFLLKTLRFWHFSIYEQNQSHDHLS